MYKKLMAIITLFVLIFGIPVFSASQNLIPNAGFEDGMGFPSKWLRQMWYDDPGITEFQWNKDNSHSGQKGIGIINYKPNHSCLLQTIKVQPDSKYLISCWVKAENVPKGQIGANIGIKDQMYKTDNRTDTKGAWELIKLYGTTEKDQKELSFFIGLGTYGSLSTGTVSFDDISVEKVESIPGGVGAVSFAPPKDNAIVDDDNTKIYDMFTNAKGGWTSVAIIIIVLYTVIAIYFLFFYKRKETGEVSKHAKGKSLEEKKYLKYLWFLIGGGQYY